MKVVALLIFWTLASPPAGHPGESFPCDCGVARHAEGHFESAVIHQPRELSSPDDPNSGNLDGSLWDEEDSDDDRELGATLSLSWSVLIRERDALSSFGHGRVDFVRTPSQSHPLRC
jgi:hypothetical protein